MTAEEKLATIAAIYDTVTEENGHEVSTHAHDNLMGAVLRLKHIGKADEIVMDTLERVQTQLSIIGKVLEDKEHQEVRNEKT